MARRRGLSGSVVRARGVARWVRCWDRGGAVGPHGVSYHSLWQDLLGRPRGPSVAGSHPARIKEGVRLGDNGLGCLLVRVGPGAVGEAAALEQP